MKSIAKNSVPKIYVTTDVLDAINKYQAKMTKRAVFVCDFSLSDDGKSLTLYDIYLPEQTSDYSKNQATFEEIHKFLGCLTQPEDISLENPEAKDLVEDDIYTYGIIRNTLTKTVEEFDQKDFDYFSMLWDGYDKWFVCGEFAKEDNGQVSFVLWYVDEENGLAYSFCEPYSREKYKYDFCWNISYSSNLTIEEVEKNISKQLKSKKYNGWSNSSSSSSSSSRSDKYSSYWGYSGGYADGYSSYKAETKPKEKSQLNKEDKPIFDVV